MMNAIRSNLEDNQEDIVDRLTKFEEAHEKFIAFEGKVRIDIDKPGRSKIYGGRMIKRANACDNLNKLEENEKKQTLEIIKKMSTLRISGKKEKKCIIL